MIYLNNFDTHTSYEEKVNVGGIDFKIPNVSYCKDVKDVHFNPYNLIKFYVGEITPSQTVKIYTDANNHLDVTVSEGNKWYSYLLPKDKGLFRIEGDSVKKVIIKADINTNGITIIPNLVVEASFKGSNTSKVTNMNSMFGLCSGLTSLNLSNFDTSKVTDMNSMFGLCSGLTSLNLSNFDTSKVTDMRSMFNGCSGLKSLDVGSFDTSNVTSMYSMFYNCSSLTSLDLRNFNTSKVDDMNGMFYGCSNLTSLDLSSFDTSNVTSMVSMFGSCSGLETLDLSDWVISDATDTSGMFNGCGKLSTITMKGCSEATIGKIQTQLEADRITGVTINP